MLPTTPQRATHDYQRNGTTDLFAETPAVHKWLRHRRFHFHFTPTYGS